MSIIAELLEQSTRHHRHLCPRQVLGVRMGLLAGEVLGLDVPQPYSKKRLFTIVETDGCAADGLSVATNCWVGRRTLRVEDYGKVAATFIDRVTEQAVRICPRNSARKQADKYAPEAKNRWEAMLLGYQRMPDMELLIVQTVKLAVSVETIISLPKKRAICDACGEEIMNEREVVGGGVILCRACTGNAYYSVLGDEPCVEPSSLKRFMTED